MPVTGTRQQHPAPLLPHARLLDVLADDPDAALFARCEFPAEPAPTGWVHGAAAAMLRASHAGRSGLAVLGDADDIRQLIGRLVAADAFADLQHLTVPRPLLEPLERLLPLGPGGDWDWLCSTVEPPAVPAEERLVELDDTADAAELIALNTVGNPTAESFPGSGRTELWLGIRDADDRIVAAGALHRTAAGAPHLAGIVTHPDHRGAGLGAAVVAGLTRAAQRRTGPVPGFCTLGMYAGNAVARRLYLRLGYRTVQQLASRSLVRT